MFIIRYLIEMFVHREIAAIRLNLGGSKIEDLQCVESLRGSNGGERCRSMAELKLLLCNSGDSVPFQYIGNVWPRVKCQRREVIWTARLS